LVAASKLAEIDPIPFASFVPASALWPSNRCVEVIFEMNDALALRLDQAGTLNLDDETINIIYQKHIIYSTSGVRAYAFLHALLKKMKRMKKCLLLRISIMLPALDRLVRICRSITCSWKPLGLLLMRRQKSLFFLSALQEKGIEIDRFVDRLDNVPEKDPLHEELTLTELIL
jgi:hypothetical protein